MQQPIAKRTSVNAALVNCCGYFLGKIENFRATFYFKIWAQTYQDIVSIKLCYARF